jgi:hypothetical protein
MPSLVVRYENLLRPRCILHLYLRSGEPYLKETYIFKTYSNNTQFSESIDTKSANPEQTAPTQLVTVETASKQCVWVYKSDKPSPQASFGHGAAHSENLRLEKQQ